MRPIDWYFRSWWPLPLTVFMIICLMGWRDTHSILWGLFIGLVWGGMVLFAKLVLLIDSRSRAAIATETITLEEVLRPFATFGFNETELDEADGHPRWKNVPGEQKQPITVWFGPSDFRAIAEYYDENYGDPRVDDYECHICHRPKDGKGSTFCSYPHPV